jgi:hypothetical protein
MFVMVQELTYRRWRKARFEDVAGLVDGDPITLTWPHGGQQFTVAGTIRTIKVEDARIEERRLRNAQVPDPESGPGQVAKIGWRNVFGVESSVMVLSERAAQVATLLPDSFPSGGRHVLVVADEAGEEIADVPVYGAEVSVKILVPGVSADEAAAAVESAVRGLFERVKVLRAKGRPVSDLRFDALVESLDYTTSPPSQRQTLIGHNVTGPETSWLGFDAPRARGALITRDLPYGEQPEILVGD